MVVIGIKNVLNKFRMFMFVYWAMMLSFSGMYTMYITQMGFSKKEVGIAVTINTLSSLIGQCFIGYLVDKFKSEKKIIFLSISMGIMVAIMLVFAKIHWQLYVLIGIWGFFLYGSVPLSEAWCIKVLKTNNEQRNFGKIRGFGSIGYGLSGVMIGGLLQYVGWKIYYCYILFSVCITLISISLLGHESLDNQNLDENIEEEKSSKVSIKEALKEILKVKPLISIIALIFTYNFVLKGIYSYLGLLVSDYGGGPLNLGLTYFFDATPEVVTFFLASRLLTKFNSKRLIFIPFVLQVVRLSLILIFNSALAIMFLGILSGFAFGILATSYKTYIYDLAPAKYKASCMSLCESIIGLASVISAPVFGFVFARYGINTGILGGLVVYIIAVLILIKDMYGFGIPKNP